MPGSADSTRLATASPLASAYFLVLYVGLVVPVVAYGLVDHVLGPPADVEPASAISAAPTPIAIRV